MPTNGGIFSRTTKAPHEREKNPIWGGKAGGDMESGKMGLVT